MHYKPLTLSVLLLLGVSCSSSKPESFEEMFTHLKKEVTLKKVMLKDEDLGAPEDLAVKGNTLVLYEPKGDSLLTVFDLKSMTKKAKVLPKGQGPGEAIGLQGLLFDDEKALFYGNDLFQKQINTFSTSSFELLEQRKVGFSFDFVSKDRNTWIYSTRSQSQPFLLELANSDKNKSFGELVKIPNMDTDQVAKIMSGSFTTKTLKNKRLAWFSFLGDIFQLYDYSDSENIKLIREDALQLPVVKGSDGAMGSKTKLGVRSVSSGDKYIYALYSTKRFSDALTTGKKNSILNSKKILVFDWDGNPKALLELDKEVVAIAYNKSEGSLYGLGVDKDYAIFVIQNIDKVVEGL